MVLNFARQRSQSQHEFVKHFYSTQESQSTIDSDGEITQNTWLSSSENCDDLSQQTGKTSGSERPKFVRSSSLLGRRPSYSNYDVVIDADKKRSVSQGKKSKTRIQSPLSISSNSDYDRDVNLMKLSDIKKSVTTSEIFAEQYRETKEAFLTVKNEKRIEDCDQSSTISQLESVSSITFSSSDRRKHMKHHILTVYEQGKIDLLLSVSNEARCPEVYRLNRDTVSDISNDMKVDYIDDDMNARDVLEGA